MRIERRRRRARVGKSGEKFGRCKMEEKLHSLFFVVVVRILLYLTSLFTSCTTPKSKHTSSLLLDAVAFIYF